MKQEKLPGYPLQLESGVPDGFIASVANISRSQIYTLWYP
jgi:hypothetical protein